MGLDVQYGSTFAASENNMLLSLNNFNTTNCLLHLLGYYSLHTLMPTSAVCGAVIMILFTAVDMHLIHLFFHKGDN